jgi:hypothetical protein
MLGLSLWGCSDPVDPRGDGTLAVSTSTSGDDPDPDGFQLTVDGGGALALLPSGAAEIHLSPGRHALQLLGVAKHCSVAPGTSVEVEIVAGRTAPVAFQVSCPGTSIRVTVTTSGLDPDQDGYQLTIDGVNALALVPAGTAQVNVAPGRHTLQLLGVAEQCSVSPGTVLELDLARGSTMPVAYEVNCPMTGARITVTTTGPDPDLGGYRLVVDGGDQGTIASNGTVLVRLNPGSRTVSLEGLAADCAIDGPTSQTVTISAGKVSPIEFVVECSGVLDGTWTFQPTELFDCGLATLVLDTVEIRMTGPGRITFTLKGRLSPRNVLEVSASGALSPGNTFYVLSATKTYPYATIGFSLDGRFTGRNSFSAALNLRARLRVGTLEPGCEQGYRGVVGRRLAQGSLDRPLSAAAPSSQATLSGPLE